jgi:hypothetical protein
MHDIQARCCPGDVFVLAESHHGATYAGYDHDEEPDHVCDVSCLYDFDWSPAHMIQDSEYRAFWSGFRPGARLLHWIDACHSGHIDRGMPRPHNPPTMPRHFPVPSPENVARVTRVRKRGFWNRPRDTSLDMAFISACRSDQTAADAEINGSWRGAFSYCGMAALAKAPRNTLLDISAMTRYALQTAGYDQEPVCGGAQALKAFPGVE